MKKILKMREQRYNLYISVSNLYKINKINTNNRKVLCF